MERDCNSETGCFPDVMIKFLHGEEWVNLNQYRYYQKVVLSNGALVQMYSGWNDNVESRAEIRVDVNGFNGPNTLGKDIFRFKVLNNRIIAGGADEDHDTFEEYCNLSLNTRYNGDGCTAWVLKNENMDYLHCNDLSFDGKKRCH